MLCALGMDDLGWPRWHPAILSQLCVAVLNLSRPWPRPAALLLPYFRQDLIRAQYQRETRSLFDRASIQICRPRAHLEKLHTSQNHRVCGPWWKICAIGRQFLILEADQCQRIAWRRPIVTPAGRHLPTLD